MLPQLEESFKNIESQKSDMLQLLGSLSEGELKKQPSPSDWSPIGILEHLVLVEEWTAGPNEKPLPANARVTLKGRVFLAFANRFMRQGTRVPTDPSAEPSGSDGVESLVRRWDTSRDLLKAKLERVRKETLPYPIAMHPVAGPIDAVSLLSLLEVHLIYHLRQLPKR